MHERVFQLGFKCSFFYFELKQKGKKIKDFLFKCKHQPKIFDNLLIRRLMKKFITFNLEDQWRRTDFSANIDLYFFHKSNIIQVYEVRVDDGVRIS